MGLPSASALSLNPLLLAGLMCAAGIPLLLLRSGRDPHRTARLWCLVAAVALLCGIWLDRKSVV